MKRLKKLFALLIAAVMAAAFLTGCGVKPDNDANENSEQSKSSDAVMETTDDSIILGTWFAKTAVYNGEEYNADDLFGGTFLLLFTDNGECTMRHNDDWSVVKWELNEDGVTLSGDNTYELTFTDENKSKLLMNINGADVTLEKHEENN